MNLQFVTIKSFTNQIDFLKRKRYLKFFYVAIKFAMGTTFIISGIRKLPYIKFTDLPIENPVGEFFNVMYKLSIYWNFIGSFQILIGILIFFNRFAVIASLLMMPVTVNIFFISVTLKMNGTPVITFIMLLTNIALIIWNYKNYITFFQKPID